MDRGACPAAIFTKLILKVYDNILMLLLLFTVFRNRRKAVRNSE
jgi:hypothetical protein